MVDKHILVVCIMTIVLEITDQLLPVYESQKSIEIKLEVHILLTSNERGHVKLEYHRDKSAR
jgi:hypothetical protein